MSLGLKPLAEVIVLPGKIRMHVANEKEQCEMLPKERREDARNPLTRQASLRFQDGVFSRNASRYV
jgi:hypothetical protein